MSIRQRQALRAQSSLRPIAFDAGDTTPSVLEGNVFTVTNSGAVTITAFDDGTDGQHITVIFADANTTVAGATLKLSAAFTSTSNDILCFVYSGGTWYETSRSINAA